MWRIEIDVLDKIKHRIKVTLDGGPNATLVFKHLYCVGIQRMELVSYSRI